MAATVWQQQVFALDAKYNAYRGSGQPNFREYSADFFYIMNFLYAPARYGVNFVVTDIR